MQFEFEQQQIVWASFWHSRVRRWATPLLVIAVVGLGYVCLTRGSESCRIQFQGFSHSSTGGSLGGNTLFGLEGQTITVNYDVTELQRGRLQIRVLQNRLADIPIVLRRLTINREGPGHFQLKVPATGFYEIECDGSPGGNGYDVTYSASWAVG
ncbi:MAG: hypothetical protein WDZ59_05630 [Pirellulales bacterium]